MEKWSANGSGGQKSKIPALGEMRPRVKEVFTFELTVKPNLEVKIELDREFALTANAWFEKINTEDLPQDALRLQSSMATNKINTALQLQGRVGITAMRWKL